MKKTNLLKGLALAAVTMVSVCVTGCSEEELKINGGNTEVVVPEPAAPVASLAMTVLDFETGSVLKYEVSDITAYIGKNYTASCPVFDGYTTANDITVAVPAISKGQAIVIPVTFYVVPLGSALQDAIDELGGALPVDPTVEIVETELEATATGGLAIENGVIVNTSDVEVEMEISVPYKSGYEYRGIESRSITAEDLQRLTPATLIHKMTVTIPAQVAFTIEAVQNKVPVTLDIEGVTYGLWYYEPLEVKTTFESISHEPGHGHGHGGSNNPGGGVGEAE